MDTVNAVLDAFNNGLRSVLAVLPTGSGKTIIASQICTKYPRVVWIAHRNELLDQAERALKLVGHNNFTLQSIYAEPKVVDCDLLVLDESHHEPAITVRRLIDRIKYKHLLGLTATPYRMDNKIMSFNTVIYGVGLDDLVNDRYLVPIHLVNVVTRSPHDLIKWMYVHPEYMHKSIIFVKDKSDGRFYTGLLSTDYIVAEIYGESDRARIIHEYQYGNIDVLVSCVVLTEGTDLPCTNTVVIARNTKSKTLLTQMVGRAMRPYKSKTHCNVIQPITIDSSSKSVRDIIIPEQHFVSSYRDGLWVTTKLSA